jgi:hypothetical protein
LKSILHDLEVELAVTAAIAIAASFVSFGAGAVAGTAKAAHSITKFARIIKDAIGAWKITKNISKGVKRVHDIAGLRKRLERIKNLGRKGKPDEKPPALQSEFSDFEQIWCALFDCLAIAQASNMTCRRKAEPFTPRRSVPGARQ